MQKPSRLGLGIWIATNVAWIGVVAVLSKKPSTTLANAGAMVEQEAGTVGAGSLLSSHRGNSIASQLEEDGTVRKVPQSIGEGFQAALKNDDPVVRMTAFAALLKDLNKDNVAEALKAIEESPNTLEGDDALLVNFMRAWGRIDPVAAMDYALDNNEQRKFYVSNSDDKLIREWATNDPEAAKAYLDKVPLDHKMNRPSLHTNLVMGMATQDLDGAAAYAEENQFGRDRGRSIDFLAKSFMEEGEGAMRRWLDGIDAKGENKRRDYKEHAIAEAAELLAKNSPGKAQAWIEGYLVEGLVDGRALEAAAEGMVKQDPVGAVDWLMRVAEGRDRSNALASTIDEWAEDDPNAAGEWLGKQDLNREMDPAVSSFAREIAREDPESALAWSGVIIDERRRAETMVRVGRDWVRRDKEAFGEWLGQNDVPEGVAKYFDRYFKK
jgi:hypothetical protein